MLHRDVKSANILLSGPLEGGRPPRIILGDLGIARVGQLLPVAATDGQGLACSCHGALLRASATISLAAPSPRQVLEAGRHFASTVLGTPYYMAPEIVQVTWRLV